MTRPRARTAETMDAEVREKIHLEILKRTGAYHANDHILLPSGQHTTRVHREDPGHHRALVHGGLGAVIAKHFAPWPIDVVVSTGPGALILSHCVARAHPSRPTVMYGTKGVSGGQAARDAAGGVPPAHPAGHQGARGGGPRQLGRDGAAAPPSSWKHLGGKIVGVGALWRRTKRAATWTGKTIFGLVSRDFPTYPPNPVRSARRACRSIAEFREAPRRAQALHRRERTTSSPLPAAGATQDMGPGRGSDPLILYFLLDTIFAPPRVRTVLTPHDARGPGRGDTMAKKKATKKKKSKAPT